ncbi:hypothetical protein ACHAWF_009819 [Thalassiosira exigua]
MAAYLAVCVSTINILQISPLFFLGATLIFIGYDLLWEWLIDIRVKIFLMEYVILLVTFVAIQLIGMDFGILFGVVVALVEHVASTTRVSSMGRVLKRSRAVWSNDDWKALQAHGYNADPKIVCLELKGPCFFGSSAKLLQDITDEIGLSMSSEEVQQIALATPHTSTPHSRLKAQKVMSPRTPKKKMENLRAKPKPKNRPQFVVLDFTQMHNLDASAATSCFLQLAKLCEKRGILLCACGTVPRVEWMLRSHSVAYGFDEEIDVKNDMLSNKDSSLKHGKLILFLTIFENILRGELSEEEKELADGIQPYYDEALYQPGETVFQKNTHPDSFYIVLEGAIAVPRERMGTIPSMIRSGAGKVQSSQSLSSSNLMGLVGEGGEHKSVESFHKVGGIFGYCDFLLERYRTFEAVAASNEGATVAVFTRAHIDRMKNEDGPLYVIVQKLLLRASLMDLANCTCHN